MAPQESEVTSVTSWKKPVGEKLELPSGNVCLVKRPGMEKLFAAGVLPDELTKIALANIDAAQAPGKPQDHLPKGGVASTLDPETMKKFMESEGALQDIFASFDRVAEMCIIEPPVKYHMRKKVDAAGQTVVDHRGRVQWEEILEHERNEGILYTDEVDAEDKSFIFNFVVGGTRDIEQFREETSDDVADLQPREDVELPPI